jgi:hypothetical protein
MVRGWGVRESQRTVAPTDVNGHLVNFEGETCRMPPLPPPAVANCPFMVRCEQCPLRGGDLDIRVEERQSDRVELRL